MIRVTFSAYSKVLKKHFPVTAIEEFQTLEDARLRAYALNWNIAKVEEV